MACVNVTMGNITMLAGQSRRSKIGMEDCGRNAVISTVAVFIGNAQDPSLLRRCHTLDHRMPRAQAWVTRKPSQ